MRMKIMILCILLLLRIGPDIIRNFKRHSDGTFTSDFINNLDRMKAKDFVEWLSMNTNNNKSKLKQPKILTVSFENKIHLPNPCSGEIFK
uniref:Glucagon / GIP / secretin / VIP family domain-containing protein n=1 Tax=Poecilia reticulata TaxID=8081 RepID=A0A3P9QG09_POERE